MTVRTAIDRVDAAFSAVERVFIALAAFASIAIMLIVSFDTVLRYVFHSPLLWSIDVVSRYLMVATFYLAISYAFHKGDHIRLLACRPLFGTRLKGVADAVIYLASAVIFAVIFWRFTVVAIEQFETAEAAIGAYLYPTWISSALVALGSLMMTIRLVIRALVRLIDAADRKEDLALVEDVEDLAI
jgi:TRAP-type C4-dicarboxylate transport system permease small subunit